LDENLDLTVAELAELIPGAVFDTAKGVLVPDGLGAWVLKPRNTVDLELR
jgi:hypothetical protein